MGATSNVAGLAARNTGTTTTEQDYIDDAGADGTFDPDGLVLSPRGHRWS